MLNPKTCREHASKCTQTAETFPPGEQRQKFLDMAEDWTRLANSVEGLEASLSQAPANSNEPYRFGSRIDAQQSSPPSARKKLPMMATSVCNQCDATLSRSGAGARIALGRNKVQF